MSDRGRIRCAVLAALMLPTGASGQSTTELANRLRQLETLRRDATRAVAAAQAARIEPLDTIRAGSLVVVVRPGDAVLVRPAATQAWTRLDSLYGDAAEDLATGPMLFFLQGQPLLEVSATTARLQRVMTPSEATSSDVAFQLVRAGSAKMRALIDTTLANWLGPQLLADVPFSLLLPRAYIELVTVPSIAVRQCYAGATDACGAALGTVEGKPVSRWYDPSEQRDLVRENQTAPHMGLRSAINSCLENESDEACIEVLRTVEIGPPLSGDARQALARMALAAGGRHAFRRLTQSAGQPLQQRLALASGMPIDSLLRRWRSDVIAARPQPVTLSPLIGWTALGWSIAFGLLALRSTRWR